MQTFFTNYRNKKQLKNVGPIRHCEPPHAACFTLPFTRCRYCRTPPAHRCPQQHRQQRRQRQRVTEGTAMAPWNGPNNMITDQTQNNEYLNWLRIDNCWTRGSFIDSRFFSHRMRTAPYGAVRRRTVPQYMHRIRCDSGDAPHRTVNLQRIFSWPVRTYMYIWRQLAILWGFTPTTGDTDIVTYLSTVAGLHALFCGS